MPIQSKNRQKLGLQNKQLVNNICSFIHCYQHYELNRTDSHLCQDNFFTLHSTYNFILLLNAIYFMFKSRVVNLLLIKNFLTISQSLFICTFINNNIICKTICSNTIINQSVKFKYFELSNYSSYY